MTRTRRRAALALAAVAVFLIPWTVYLTSRLPSHHRTPHWGIAWAGFDIALAASSALTAYALARRPGLVPIAATITGTLLVCDAWFDVLTSDHGEVIEAALEAGFAELPLAALCFWLAADSERTLVRAVAGAVKGEPAE